jgi:hypothetical protein
MQLVMVGKDLILNDLRQRHGSSRNLIDSLYMPLTGSLDAETTKRLSFAVIVLVYENVKGLLLELSCSLCVPFNRINLASALRFWHTVK